MSKLFIVYDARAMSGGTEAASVLFTAESLKEAVKDTKDMFGEGVVYSYDVVGEKLENAKFESFISEV